MLDALVTEARDRWGMDVSAGIQIVPAETSSKKRLTVRESCV